MKNLSKQDSPTIAGKEAGALLDSKDVLQKSLKKGQPNVDDEKEGKLLNSVTDSRISFKEMTPTEDKRRGKTGKV